MQRVAGSMSTSTGVAPVAGDRLERRDERAGHGDDLAPGTRAEREQREPQRLGAVADADAVRGAAVAGERGLELVEVGGERERPGPRDPVERRGELRLERLVGAPQVDERDLAHAASEIAATGVLTRIFMSVRRLLERAYSASRSSISVKPTVLLPDTCHRPVMPGLTANRS